MVHIEFKSDDKYHWYVVAYEVTYDKLGEYRVIAKFKDGTNALDFVRMLNNGN